MSTHVSPHRWADAWAGRVDDDERAQMERHADRCHRCSRARARVQRASDTFTTIRTQSSPDLSWDAVRAKVHWSVSTERRAKVKPAPKLSGGWIGFGVVAAAGLAAIVFVDRPAPVVEAIAHDAGVSAPLPSPVPQPEVTALAGLVNRTTGDVMIDGIRPDPGALFSRRLAAGNKIATADGRVDVQFGPASAFGLGPHSTLELRRFDAQLVELVVEGTIDVQVAPRGTGQRFIVHAGDRTIEVRGTQFRVTHTQSGATQVACRHGLVAVRDISGQLELGGARRIELGVARPITDHRVLPMSTEQVAELAEATPLTMPVWDLVALATSAPLAIATAGRRDVRLDGVELGAAPLRVRVMPGRHTVEAADGTGRYRRAGWVDVAPGGKPAHLDVLPEPVPTRGIDTRRREFTAGVDKGRLAQCMRTIVKSGLATGAYVDIEISVDAQGAVPYLNILDTDLGGATRQCIHDALRAVRFKPGTVTAWRQRIDL